MDVLTFFSKILPCGLEPDFTMNPKQSGIHVTTVQRLSISLSHARYHIALEVPSAFTL